MNEFARHPNRLRGRGLRLPHDWIRCGVAKARWIGRLLLLIVIVAGCTHHPSNHAPVANAGADQVVDAEAPVTLDGSASRDPDGDALTFSWKQTLGTPVSLSSTSAPVVTLTAPANGTTLRFELTVSDRQRDSVAKLHVSVHPVEPSAHVTEVRQLIPDDPAVTGDSPNGWLVPTVDWPVRPPAEGEIEQFREQYKQGKVLFTPVVGEDLSPGATRTVELQVAGPSGLSGSAQWVGTSRPLEVTISLDGSTLATGAPYHFGPNRGGSLLHTWTTMGRRATMSVSNTSEVTVKVRVVLASSGL